MTTAIDLHELTKRYGGVTAVDGMDLRVERGEVVAFLGPNGAGKSTTIDMMLGLAKPDAGEVRVLGQTPQRAVAEGASPLFCRAAACSRTSPCARPSP